MDHAQTQVRRGDARSGLLPDRRRTSMRHANIQLLASARQGNRLARCEIGRRYLLGEGGFPRNVPTGLDYLTHASVRGLAASATAIAEVLTLEEIVQFRQEEALEGAAHAGSAAACLKLALLLLTHTQSADKGVEWLRAAAAGGHARAAEALRLVGDRSDSQQLLQAIAAALGDDNTGLLTLILLAVRDALAQGDTARMWRFLSMAEAVAPEGATGIAELVAAAVRQSEGCAALPAGLSPRWLHLNLSACADCGDTGAMFTLGRALCGVRCGLLEPRSLSPAPNMRKGVALLLRAAGAGHGEAWYVLYQLHRSRGSWVCNPHAALLYLEHAAVHDVPAAQRKLGTLLMRSASSLDQAERAIELLWRARDRADPLAAELLETLLLPVAGPEQQARAALEPVRRADAGLALRLELSRAFGLTKLEALCVDPVQGMRSWGLVVQHNPSVVQPRLAAPRAVPSRSPAAAETLRHAASYFAGRTMAVGQDDVRRQARRHHRLLRRLGLDESLFFAAATSRTRDSVRCGTKWAH
jgi:TPR repeat protein